MLTESATISPADETRASRTIFLITISVFLSAYLIFSISPIFNTSDSMYSMVLSESILHRHSTHLNTYQFPDAVAELASSAPPIDNPQNLGSYQLGKVHGNIVYCYPNGSSILSLPFVAMMNAAGISAVNLDRTYNKTGEFIIQKTLAALLMALFSCVVFRMALLMLNAAPSVFIAVGFALGTQVWSTGTRALWSHTWFILLGGLAAYHILRAETQRDKLWPVALATILSWMYFVRPTGAIPIACVSVYIFICHRSVFVAFAETGATWFAGFIAYSWITYGELIPGYYRSRFAPHEFWTAVFGNLFSPSRGLFIYVPILAFVMYVVIRYWRALAARRLAILALSAIVANLIAIAAYPCWWGGYCYGARLMMDALPWFVVLAILGCAAASSARDSILTTSELSIAIVLLILSIAINGRGAFSPPTQQWSTVVDIDEHPERAFDWSYPQFVAGLVTPPDYVIENTNRLRQAASSRAMAK